MELCIFNYARVTICACARLCVCVCARACLPACAFARMKMFIARRRFTALPLVGTKSFASERCLAAGQQTGGSNNPATRSFMCYRGELRARSHTSSNTSPSIRIVHSACMLLTVNLKIGVYTVGGWGKGKMCWETLGSRIKNLFVERRHTA